MEIDETIRQTEAVVRFAEEVDRRLAEFGVNGAAELVAMYQQLARGVGVIDLAELERALHEIQALLARMRSLEADLARLIALKIAFEVPH
jgi:hypothetical protein